ncbi:hypothetical protein R3P38DRAFT_3293474 [Favolaschia claudopus]|uniref:Uncharacterized protein n=1 Tax=Favolaschia claudopus TaxID=2862362 RepID=A0AAV9ZHE2_9AGAR
MRSQCLPPLARILNLPPLCSTDPIERHLLRTWVYSRAAVIFVLLFSRDSHPPSPLIRTLFRGLSHIHTASPLRCPYSYRDPVRLPPSPLAGVSTASPSLGSSPVPSRLFLMPPPPRTRDVSLPHTTPVRRFALIDPVRVIARSPPLGGDVAKEGDVLRGGLGSLAPLSRTSYYVSTLELDIPSIIDYRLRWSPVCRRLQPLHTSTCYVYAVEDSGSGGASSARRSFAPVGGTSFWPCGTQDGWRMDDG